MEYFQFGRSNTIVFNGSASEFDDRMFTLNTAVFKDPDIVWKINIIIHHFWDQPFYSDTEEHAFFNVTSHTLERDVTNP